MQLLIQFLVCHFVFNDPLWILLYAQILLLFYMEFMASVNSTFHLDKCISGSSFVFISFRQCEAKKCNLTY